MTCPPAASMRAAAAITSITMNGGTSLRPDAVKRCLARSLKVASNIDICYFRDPIFSRPQTSRIPRFGRAYPVSAPPPIDKDHPKINMLFRFAPHLKTSKLTAALTAVALTLASLPARAQEQQKGPSVLRDTETEQLLRDYTRPILRTAGLEKQNIQVVIIIDSVFNAFVADGHRIFVNYGAIMQSETPNQLIGVLAHETGHLAGGHLAKMRQQLAQA